MPLPLSPKKSEVPTLKIVVCMKETPSTEVPKTLGADMRLVRKPEDTIINPFDEYTVEEGLRLQEKLGGDVIVLTMGPGATTDPMRRAMAMGATSGVFVTDPALAGSDAVATGRTLAAALKKLEADLVLFGQSSADAAGGVVPSIVAEFLGRPLLAFASKVEVEGNTVTIQREAEVGYTTVQAPLPALVSVAKAINNNPRYPSMKGIMSAKKKPLETWTLADLGLEASTVGAQGAKERVTSATPVSTQRRREIVAGNDGAAQRILNFLIEQKII
jgi:electron transfer flavoprotein beta subunit